MFTFKHFSVVYKIMSVFVYCDGVYINHYLPVVIWHGMLDSCCNPNHFAGALKKHIEEKLANIYVHSVKIGGFETCARAKTIFGDANKQVEQACRMIRQDSKLAGGYNGLGLSQGSQLLRAVAQRCPHPRMYNLVTLGGQHQGIYGVPALKKGSFLNNWAKAISSWDIFQNNVIGAQFWHDPLNEEAYRERNNFIAEINNEKVIKEEYRQNLMKLNRFVMVKFRFDTYVVPNESSWFGFYAPGQDDVITELEHSQLYLEDRLGLRKLAEDGKIVFIEVQSEHLAVPMAWFDIYLLENFSVRVSELRNP